jgi:hypothetical protein
MILCILQRGLFDAIGVPGGSESFALRSLFSVSQGSRPLTNA